MKSKVDDLLKECARRDTGLNPSDDDGLRWWRSIQDTINRTEKEHCKPAKASLESEQEKAPPADSQPANAGQSDAGKPCGS